MAGGSGTRFWPLSRAAKPKQFLPLTSSRPLIAETLRRLQGLAPTKNVRVVCGVTHASQVRKALPALPKNNIVVEPMARNTAPAIALATMRVMQVNAEGIVVVLPSDQHVADVPAFRASMSEAIRAARDGAIVTLGITPTRAETGYGYIRVGAAIDVGRSARSVAAFVEKPDLATAQKYLTSGDFLWNAGIFVFRADVMYAAFSTYMPDLFSALVKMQKAPRSRAASVIKREFMKMPSTSIDYGIAERASKMVVVPSSCGWSDVGSFNALPEVRPTDANGNVVAGKQTLVIDSKGCVVLGEGKRVVAVVGLTDVVVIETADSVLVLPKAKSQDVRKVVEALKAKKSKLL
jgi:mannose-1-phosphate guanylyltransferase